jgi:hypothetical protein
MSIIFIDYLPKPKNNKINKMNFQGLIELNHHNSNAFEELFKAV